MIAIGSFRSKLIPADRALASSADHIIRLHFIARRGTPVAEDAAEDRQ